jgi:hypothetical protein
MHLFIYPTHDSYITNHSELSNKNVGLDEILELNASNRLVRTIIWYSSASVSSSFLSSTRFDRFSGSADAYLSGSGVTSYMQVVGAANVSGTFTGVFTGSRNGVNHVTSSYTGSTALYSGSLSGSLSGTFSGVTCDMSGSLNTFTGYGQGIFIGTQSAYTPRETYENSPLLSRILIKFSTSHLSASIASGEVTNTGSFQCYLKMRIAQEHEIPLAYTVYGYPISQSWDAGVGRSEYGGSDIGVSWYYKDQNFGSMWYPTSSTNTYANVNYLTSSTYATESFKHGGGTWYYSIPNSYTSSSGFCESMIPSKSLIATQSFDYSTSDLSLDVTDIVKSWICGCIPNQGIILLSSQELSSTVGINGIWKFFGKETNTIYSPYLDVQWNDSVYTTGSMVSVSSTTPYTIVLKNVQREYKRGSLPRINVFARAKYPLNNFVPGVVLNHYMTSSLLPAETYYSIKDNNSELTLLDFDDGTKVSADGNIHYFTFDTAGLPVDRFYRILIKTVLPTGEIEIFDNNNIFKVTR